MARWPLAVAATSAFVLAVGCGQDHASRWEELQLERPPGSPGRSSWCIEFSGGFSQTCEDVRFESPFGDGEAGERVTISQAEELTAYDAPVPPADDRTGRPAVIWWNPDGDPLVFAWESGLRLFVRQTDLSSSEAQEDYATRARECPGVQFVTEVRGVPALAQDVGRGAGCAADLALVTFVERGLELELMSPFHTADDLLEVAGDIEWS